MAPSARFCDRPAHRTVTAPPPLQHAPTPQRGDRSPLQSQPRVHLPPGRHVPSPAPDPARQEDDRHLRPARRGAVAEGDVTVRVEWSSLNFRTRSRSPAAARSCASGRWCRGIDLAGTVEQSASPGVEAGRPRRRQRLGPGRDALGRLRAEGAPAVGWLLPAGGVRRAPGDGHRHGRLHRRAVRDGAAQARPVAGRREVLVTSAAGGGARSRSRCSRSSATPSSPPPGRAQEADYLRGLGASAIIDRNELSARAKPLQTERWAGVVDAVGSHRWSTRARADALSRRGRDLRPGPGRDLPAR